MTAPDFLIQVITTLQASLVRQFPRDPAQVLQADMAIRNIVINKLHDATSPIKERNLLALRQGDPQILPWAAEFLCTVSSEQVLLSTLENANSSNNDFIMAERLAWFRRAEAEKLDLEIVPWLAMMRDFDMAVAVARWYSTDDHSVMSLGIYARGIMLDPRGPLPPLTKDQELELEALVEPHGEPVERRRYPCQQKSVPGQSKSRSARA